MRYIIWKPFIYRNCSLLQTIISQPTTVSRRQYSLAPSLFDLSLQIEYIKIEINRKEKKTTCTLCFVRTPNNVAHFEIWWRPAWSWSTNSESHCAVIHRFVTLHRHAWYRDTLIWKSTPNWLIHESTGRTFLMYIYLFVDIRQEHLLLLPIWPFILYSKQICWHQRWYITGLTLSQPGSLVELHFPVTSVSMNPDPAMLPDLCWESPSLFRPSCIASTLLVYKPASSHFSTASYLDCPSLSSHSSRTILSTTGKRTHSALAWPWVPRPSFEQTNMPWSSY